MLSKKQQITKRIFDIVIAVIGIIILIIPMLVFILIATFSTRLFGVFLQKRVGQQAQLFIMYKIKTMREVAPNKFQVTGFGKFLRSTKLDELPQLFNVLFGDMSLVGPRPDIEGYADKLVGEDIIILSVKPGITGPATLMFSEEEITLAQQENPLEYNDTVLWPQKVEINKEYIKNWSLTKDFGYIIKTISQFVR